MSFLATHGADSMTCGYTLRGDLGEVVDRGLVSDYIRLCETAHFLRDVTSRNFTIAAFILLQQSAIPGHTHHFQLLTDQGNKDVNTNFEIKFTFGSSLPTHLNYLFLQNVTNNVTHCVCIISLHYLRRMNCSLKLFYHLLCLWYTSNQ